MIKVISAEEMREIDRLTTERFGIPPIQLMENAANACAKVVLEKSEGSIKGKSILILCGKGNNGGDGAALGRLLFANQAKVALFLFGKIGESKGDARINFERFRDLADEEDTLSFKEDAKGIDFEDFSVDIMIDALFGTGLTRPIDQSLADIIDNGINRLLFKKKALIFSIDLPSGLNADLSEGIGWNFNADITITFTSPKLANIFPPASRFNRELHIADIGSPPILIDESPSKLFLSEKEDVIKWLNATELKPDSYKKSRGSALIIAGSKEYPGAAALAANACFASGCGMVALATTKEIIELAASRIAEEIIIRELDGGEAKEDAAAIGCGMAQDQETHQFIRNTILNRKSPMILDAEALNALSSRRNG
jgi:ADP-dependent NAD(P)H-hydrate dehydratase / NAD(P)H-hydrate epimerase